MTAPADPFQKKTPGNVEKKGKKKHGQNIKTQLTLWARFSIGKVPNQIGCGDGHSQVVETSDNHISLREDYSSPEGHNNILQYMQTAQTRLRTVRL